MIVDWTGVTIGYQGRYFQTRNKAKGGAFEGDGFTDFLTFVVGDGEVIPAIDEVRTTPPRWRSALHITANVRRRFVR